MPLIRRSRDAANVDELVAAVGAEHAAAPSLHEHEERLVQSARGLIDETKQLLAALERRDVEAYRAHGARYVIHKNELIELDFDVRTTCRGKLPPEAGTLRPTTVRYFIKRRLPRFFACLPRGTSSDFILRFEIQADGSVADVKVRRNGTERYPDEVPDPGTEPFFERLGYARPAAPIDKDVAGCMVDWFSRSQFPPPEGGPFQQRVRFSIRSKKRR